MKYYPSLINVPSSNLCVEERGCTDHIGSDSRLVLGEVITNMIAVTLVSCIDTFIDKQKKIGTFIKKSPTAPCYPSNDPN